MELGTHRNVLKTPMGFVVVNISCVLNTILGRPGIAKTGAVISMMHLCMKLYTSNGIGVVRSSQKSERKCYLEAFKRTNREDMRINTIS